MEVVSGTRDLERSWLLKWPEVPEDSSKSRGSGDAPGLDGGISVQHSESIFPGGGKRLTSPVKPVYRAPHELWEYGFVSGSLNDQVARSQRQNSPLRTDHRHRRRRAVGFRGGGSHKINKCKWRDGFRSNKGII